MTETKSPFSTAPGSVAEPSDPCVVLLIPCYNEEQTIARVIEGFRAELPGVEIVIIDNASTDRTAAIAIEHGAQVVSVTKKGKGCAVRAAFARVDADIYIMTDGDVTYEPRSCPAMLEMVKSGQADMVVGRRVSADPGQAYRPLHEFGNRLVCKLINVLFSAELIDIMSGYRVFTRDVVRATPLVSRGFEIETELTIQALGQDFKIVEVDSPYYARVEGSFSKLRTFRDGSKVLWTILSLFMVFKPLTFFGLAGLVLLLPGAAMGTTLLVKAVSGTVAGGSPILSSLAALLCIAGMSMIVLGVVLTNINNRFMAMTSLLTRGRLMEPHPSRARRQGVEQSAR